MSYDNVCESGSRVFPKQYSIEWYWFLFFSLQPDTSKHYETTYLYYDIASATIDLNFILS